jgi:hypothetical protein
MKISKLFVGAAAATADAAVASCKKGVLIPLALVGLAAGGAVVPVSAGATTTSTGSKATVHMNGKTYKFSGGACVVNGSKVDIGIGTGQNSLGLNASVSRGKFSNAQIGLILNGQPVAITSGSGTVNSKNSGKFTGTDVVSSSTVTGTFSC